MDLEDLLNPEEQRQFRRLCIATSVEELDEQASVVELHVEQVKEMAEPATDVDTAVLIGDALGRLLGSGLAFDDDQRAQIRGAIEYFVMAESPAGEPMGYIMGKAEGKETNKVVLWRHVTNVVPFQAAGRSGTAT